MTNAIVRNAKAKIIERRFRDIKDQLSRLFDTFTGGNVLEKPEKLKHILKNGEIPLDSTLITVVDELLEGYFNEAPYGGAVAEDRGKPRMQVYQEQLHKKRVAPPEELALMLMRSARPQKVTRRGVHLDIAGERIDYWNDEMLMNLLGQQVYFRYDPDDLSEVRIYDLKDRYIMSVPADTYREGTAYIIFIVLFLFFTILNPTFASGRNIMNILRSTAPYLIAGMGIIFVMMTGGIDLSVGYIMATAACCCAMMIESGMPSLAAVLICIVIGFALGCINGILAAKMKVFPLIITLATQMVFSGLVALIAGKGKHNVPVADQWLNTITFLGLPISFWIGVVLIAIVWFVLNKMHFGRNVLAVGGNKECARLAGIKVDYVTMMCYALCGAFFALAGCVVMSVQGYADTTTGPGYKFTCLTAAIIGGISMMGGKGNVMGMVVGIFIIQIIGNGMQMALIESDTQNVVKGIILLAAVAFDIFKNVPRAKIRTPSKLPSKAGKNTMEKES